MNLNHITPVLNQEVVNLKTQIMQYPFNGGKKVNTNIDFEYDENGFYIYLTLNNDEHVTIIYNADVKVKDIGNIEIVEFSNVDINEVAVNLVNNSCYLDPRKAVKLLEIGKDIAVNARQYKFVEDDIYTTDDLEATCAELYSEYSDNEY